MNRGVNIAVVGAGATEGDDIDSRAAYEAGRAIAAMGWNLVCGGLEGVMESACRGAFEMNGTTIGILPGYNHDDANDFVKIAIPTGIGHARNAIIAASCDGMVAVGGGHGTLSEIALALKMGKPVVEILSEGVSPRGVKGLLQARSADDAIALLKRTIAGV